MFGPVVKGALVALRPGRDDDAERFVEWFADMEVTRFLARRFAVALYQEHEFLKKIGESPNDVFWMIDAEGRPVGATGIHAIDWVNARATTGIVIGEKGAWGKGYATETMGLRTRYAFRELNLHKLTTEVNTANVASKRALEKNGYRTVGIHREHDFARGRWEDRWLGEVLRAEWEKQQQG